MLRFVVRSHVQHKTFAIAVDGRINAPVFNDKSSEHVNWMTSFYFFFFFHLGFLLWTRAKHENGCGIRVNRSYLSAKREPFSLPSILVAEWLFEAGVQRVVAIHSGLRQVRAELLIQRVIAKERWKQKGKWNDIVILPLPWSSYREGTECGVGVKYP